MKLEQQVTSLELSKRLKELGVPQNGYCMWGNFGNQWDLMVKDRQGDNFDYWHKNGYFPTAFTVAELGEMLPILFCFTFSHATGGWSCRYEPSKGELRVEEADTEADARAKMLIYLLENKLITL